VLDGGLILWGGSEGVLSVMSEEPGLREVPVILTYPCDLLPAPFPGRDGWPGVQALWKPYSWAVLLDCVRAAASREGCAGKGSAERALPPAGAARKEVLRHDTTRRRG
jgi:hypothetical protein